MITDLKQKVLAAAERTSVDTVQFSYHFDLLVVELFFSSAAAERKVHLRMNKVAVLLTRIFENNGYHRSSFPPKRFRE